jgi:hypothetical protein
MRAAGTAKALAVEGREFSPAVSKQDSRPVGHFPQAGCDLASTCRPTFETGRGSTARVPAIEHDAPELE